MTPSIKPERLQQLTTWRQELHRYPELSGREEATSDRILRMLDGLHPDRVRRGLGGHGILAAFEGAEAGPNVLFRAELDALPIEEENDLPYRSQHSGVSHKCGHDGHMAILLGLAGVLSEKRPPRGTVYLLFQPAEEDGSGAMAVLQDPAFAAVRPDYVFALHNLPGYPMGAIITRHGAFTAAVRSLIIRLKGKTSHAAEPEHGINPAGAIAEILQLSERMDQPDPGRDDFALITPVHVRMGEPAYGVSAGYGEVHLTLRCWTPERMERLAREYLRCTRDIAGGQQLDMETSWTNTFFANFNDDESVHLICGVANHHQLNHIVRRQPLKWGEDFGAFTQRFRGAMFGLGAGPFTAALHNPDYDFPDQVIEPGVRMFAGLCEAVLGQGAPQATGAGS